MEFIQKNRIALIIIAFGVFAAGFIIAPKVASAHWLDWWWDTYPNQPPRYVCPLILNPVCGVNGQTYDNSCFAHIRGVQIAHIGRCGQPFHRVPTPTPIPYYDYKPQIIPPTPTPYRPPQPAAYIYEPRRQPQTDSCPHCPNCEALIGLCPDPAKMNYSSR